MPIYEYECEKCKHTFEVLQKSTDDPVKDCPECEEKDCVHKLISASGFRLKGSDWFKKTSTLD